MYRKTPVKGLLVFTATALLLLSGSAPAHCARNSEAARQKMEEGIKLYKQGHLARALTSLNHAIDQDASHLPAYAARAAIHHALTHFKEAREDIAKCTSMEAENVLELTLKGNIRLLTGDIPTAMNNFNQAILSNSYYADAYVGRGRAYQMTGNLREAMEDWKKALELDPKLVIAQFNRAYVSKISGETNRTEEFIKQVLEANPKFPPVHALLGLIAAEGKDYDQAIADYSQAIQLNSRYSYAHIGRAYAYLQIGNKENAFRDFDEAIRASPKEYAPYLERGETYWRLAEYDSAVSDFKKALETHLDYTPAALTMGERLLAAGLKEESLQMHSKALDAARTGPPSQRVAWTETALLQRAILHIKLHEHDQALSDIDLAVEISSESANSLIARANYYFHMAQDGRARAELDHILEDYPQYPPALLLQGKIYTNYGRWKEALQAFNAAIEGSPDLADAYNARGMLYAHFALGNDTRGRSSPPSKTFSRTAVPNDVFGAKDVFGGAPDYEKAVADIRNALARSFGNPEYFLNLATIEAKRGSYRSALESLDKASVIKAIDAPTFDILQSRTQLHSILGNVQVAREDVQSALRLKPQSISAHAALADINFQTLNPAQAQKDLARALELGAKSPQIRLKLGLAYAIQGIYDSAIQELKQAASEDPKSIETHYILCRSLRLNKAFTKALKSCDQAVEADSAMGTIDRGLTYFRLKSYKKAASDLKVGFSKGARYASAELARSASHAMLGQFRESDEAYRSAMDIDPTARELEIGFIGGKPSDFPDYGAFLLQQKDKFFPKDDPFAFLVRGNAWSNSGQFETAIAEYTKALEMNAGLYAAYLNRCDALAAGGSMGSAEEDCRHALDLSPKDPQSASRLIQILILSGRWEPALATTVAAIRGTGNNPSAAEFYVLGGNIRYFMKDIALARENYKVALSLNPQNADAYNGLGLSQYSQKEFLEAIENFSRAILLNPRKESYYRNRAAVYVALGNFINAVSDYKNAQAINTDPGMTEQYQKLVQQALSRITDITPENRR